MMKSNKGILGEDDIWSDADWIFDQERDKRTMIDGACDAFVEDLRIDSHMQCANCGYDEKDHKWVR